MEIMTGFSSQSIQFYYPFTVFHDKKIFFYKLFVSSRNFMVKDWQRTTDSHKSNKRLC
ncbi:hypothetical protein KsCSTR_01540 [Candidatus Kuenenia stuttgartiensis]|uniref:Uncharacterized protein n=1 Tax=Kuenenia stuttgartiensis TaxID=174633 RepID=Q1PUY5_KUEST|nr:hypothetical protein KsCSTR_01540 [Candidatus Kuenenia stuttgartiensis]CAJ71048.1 unknown protein [Candidatus Kuenenia stuttgartiensis]